MGGLIFLLVSTYLHFAIVSVLYGIGGSLMSPSYNSLISGVVPWNMRGSRIWTILHQSGTNISASPYIGGIKWKTLEPKAPFMVPLVASLLVTPLLWFKLEQVSKDTDL